MATDMVATRGEAATRWALVLAACALIAGPDDAYADGPFDQGRVQASFGATFATAYDSSYVVVGLGLGYYLIDGLEFGVGSEIWLGPGPFIAQVSPRINYVLDMSWFFAPYLGTFYRHWFIGGSNEDRDSVGIRAGAFLIPGGLALVGLGAAYEYTFAGCLEDESCGRVYPEIQLAISF